MAKRQIFRIGIKNYPAAHGGVEAATYNFVKATKDKYGFTIFTVWDNPTVVDNEVDGVRVYQLEKGWFGRFRQIRNAVKDKKNTILHFHMEIFILHAIVFSLLGYNVVSSIHGLSWHNPKMSWLMHCCIWFVDVLGVNLVRRTIYVAKQNQDTMRHYTFRKTYFIPNGSKTCPAINYAPDKDIVFIGRISIQKSILQIIESAERYKRKIDLYGPFDERETEYVAKVKDALAKSTFCNYCGKLKPEEIYPTISCYRYLLNASPEEASPNAVIEAGACGLFLYLSDIPGHRNVGYPDAYYFPFGKITLPEYATDNVRSSANIAYHRDNLSIEKQIERYGVVYASF